MDMNKKGWIKIVEAFVAIMLIVAVVLIIVDRTYIQEQDISERIYNVETEILEEIGLNYKADILSGNEGEIFQYVQTRTPDYLGCESKICNLNGECQINLDESKNLYVQSLLVIGDEEDKVLKLFCYLK